MNRTDTTKSYASEGTSGSAPEYEPSNVSSGVIRPINTITPVPLAASMGSQPLAASSGSGGDSNVIRRGAAAPLAMAASSSGNNSSGQQQGSSGATPMSSSGSKRQFWTRRRRIFCFVCAGIVFIIAAIMIPVVIWVILPRVVQFAVNQASFNFTNFDVIGPTQTGFTANIGAQLTGAGSFPATVRFTGPLAITYNGNQIVTLNTPQNEFNLNGGNGNFNFTFTGDFSGNPGPWNSFMKDLLLQDSLSWTLNCPVGVKVLGTIDVAATIGNKVIAFAGFKNFTSTPPVVTGFDFPGNSNNPFEGIKVVLNTEFDNPSVWSINLGDVGFNMSIPVDAVKNVSSIGNKVPTHIGEVVAYSMVIQAGRNKIPMSGALTPISKDDLNVKQLLSGLFDTFLGDVSAPLSLNGAGKFPPTDALPWITDFADEIAYTLVFDAPSNASFIRRITTGDAQDIDFVSGSNSTPKVGVDNLVANFAFQFNFPFNITASTQAWNLTYANATWGTVFAQSLPANGTWAPPAGVKNWESTYNQTVANQTVVVSESAKSAYQNWVNDVFNKNSSIITYLTGTNTLILNTVIGDLKLTNLPMPKLADKNVTTLTIAGLGGFKSGSSIPTAIFSDGNQNTLFMSWTMQLNNPASANLHIGPTSFQMNYVAADAQSHVIGNVSFTKLDLPRKQTSTFNVTVAITNPDPVTQLAVENFVSNFVLGKQVQATLTGYPGSNPINSYVNTALQNISIPNLNIPSNNNTLIHGASMSLDLNSFYNASAHVTMNIFNPFNTAWSITSFANGNVTWTDPATNVATTIGNINVAAGADANQFTGLSIPALTNGTTTVLTTLNLDVQDGLNFGRAVLHSVRTGRLDVQVSVKIIGNIGDNAGVGANGYRVPVDYTQAGTVTINAANI